MGIETELAPRVYRNSELHHLFSTGDATEMNEMVSDAFEGWLYRPSVGKMERYDAAAIRSGNLAAAKFYDGKPIRFAMSGLEILPQGPDQAAVSYQVIHTSGDKMLRALSLEVWRKEADGQWRIIRWYEEKGAPE